MTKQGIFALLKIPKKKKDFDTVSLKKMFMFLLSYFRSKTKISMQGIQLHLENLSEKKQLLGPPVRKPLRMPVSGKTRYAHSAAFVFRHLVQNYNSAKASRSGNHQITGFFFFSIFKPKHNLATLSTLLKPTLNTRKFFQSHNFVFVLARSQGSLSWLT